MIITAYTAIVCYIGGKKLNNFEEIYKISYVISDMLDNNK